MMRSILAGCLTVFCSLGIASLGGCTASSPSVVRSATSSSAVVPDTVWLENAFARVGVSPSMGRVTWFGLRGGENLLWINPETLETPPDGDPRTWVNYGGDKTWIGPQNSWRYFLPHGRQWPPDGHHDGAAWEVAERDARGLTLVSPVSPWPGLQIRRTLALAADAPRLVIDAELTAERDGTPMPAQVWNVTQVRTPSVAVLDRRGLLDTPIPWVNMSTERPRMEAEVQIRGASVHWEPSFVGGGRKFGTLGRWLAARIGDVAFTQSTGFNPEGLYPENTNLQLFAEDRYIELETLSPAARIRAGHPLRHRVVWELRALPEGEADAAWAALIDGLGARVAIAP
jgi:hypothetical protein